MNRVKKLLCVGVVGLLLAGGTVWRPDVALLLGLGAVAHDLCSEDFVSGLPPARVFADTLAPRDGLRLIAGAIATSIDQARFVVTARLGIPPLALAAQAKFYPGLGCIVLHGAPPVGLPGEAALASLAAPAALPGMELPPADLPSHARVALNAALDHAFNETPGNVPRRTSAVLVVQYGRILAERYAPGYSASTRVLGFSMTKSVANALIGILVRQGKLDIHAPAPVGAWSAPGDPRHAITIEQLMRMTSGLDFDEEDAGFADRPDQMFYLARDMAAFAAATPPRAAPGTRWAYSSAGTHILARIIRDSVGGTALDALGFARRELFGPLGMESAVMEVDATGTMIGAHYMLATARDWARFGLLYLNDGVIGGTRILPTGWVAMSAAATLRGNYGAGFWTNRSPAEEAGERIKAGMPADSFWASGNLGQRVVIIPSHRMVIVRLGNATGPGNDIGGMLRLVREVLAASLP